MTASERRFLGEPYSHAEARDEHLKAERNRVVCQQTERRIRRLSSYLYGSAGR